MDEYNPAATRRVSNEIFLPALQKAAQQAQQIGVSPNDLLSGSLNAVGEMLVTLAGKQGAAILLRGLAEHLEQRSPH